MAGAIGLHPLGALTTGALEIFDHTIAQPDGTVIVIYRDGRVRSVQPDGRVDARPAGADGAYERGCINGGVITYCPDGVHAYDFSFSPKVPNL
jgi:hypothetical protein